MAIEAIDSRILLKRTYVSGSTPSLRTTGSTDYTSTSAGWTPTQIMTGEMFLNVADKSAFFGDSVGITQFLTDANYTNYLSGSTGEYVNISGDTMTGTLFAPSISATTFSGESFQFDTNITKPDWAEGLVFYDNQEKALSYHTDVSGTSIQIGQESVVRVINKTGADILNGQVVYISGAQGNRPTIALASASAVTAHNVIGVATNNIQDNDAGYVTTEGIVRDLNTNAYSEGDTLYLSLTPGSFQSSKPAKPYHSVRIGYVTSSSINNGEILVHIQNSSDLNEIDNVSDSVTGATNYDLLQYSGVSSTWVASRDINVNTVSASTIDILASGAKRLTLAAGSTFSTITPQSGNYLQLNTQNIMLGTSTINPPPYSLSWEGSTNRSIGMGRSSNSGSSYNLTLQAGGGLASGVNQNGGTLILSSGISTGSGSSKVSIYTASGTTSGTTDINPTEKVTILGNGSVGIGTTTPTGTLNVYNSNGPYQLVLQNNGTLNDTTGIIFKNTGAVGYEKGAIFFERTGSAAEGTLHLCTRADTSAPTITKADSKLSITKDGYVGIGKTASVPLDVNGNIRLYDSLIFGTTTLGTKIQVAANTYDFLNGFNRYGYWGNYHLSLFGSTTTSAGIHMYGGNDTTIDVERNIVLAADGKILTIQAGAPYATSNNRNGGELQLKSGIATGSGSSKVSIYTASGTTSGTTDINPTEKVTILGDGSVGIGTTTPSYKLDVSGDSRITSGLKIGVSDDPTIRKTLDIAGDINFDVVETAIVSGMTLLGGTGGSLDTGATYYYQICYTTAIGETDSATQSGIYKTSITLTTGETKITLSNIPVSSDPRVINKKIYRSYGNGNAFLLYRVTTIPNSQTTYADTTADESMILTDGAYRKDNTTVKGLYFNNTLVTKIGNWNVGYGVGMNNLTTGTENVAIGINGTMGSVTTGSNNIGIGSAANAATTGNDNIAMGYAALAYNNTGSNNIALGNGALRTGNIVGAISANVAIGVGAGFIQLTGISNNVFIGNSAGYETRGSQNTIIGSLAGYSSSFQTGSQNIILGFNSGRNAFTGLTNNILIGNGLNFLAHNQTNTLNIGNSIYVTGMGTTSSKLGLYVPAPTYELSFEGSGDKNIGIERNATSAGRSLNILAGGALASSVNQSGGDLKLKSGVATGSGSSKVSIWTASGSTSGTTDVNPTEKFRIDGDGSLYTTSGGTLVKGFTGTGAFTNFTIVNGIIIDAS